MVEPIPLRPQAQGHLTGGEAAVEAEFKYLAYALQAYLSQHGTTIEIRAAEMMYDGLRRVETDPGTRVFLKWNLLNSLQDVLHKLAEEDEQQ